MGLAEAIAVTLRFLFFELPRFLEQYRLYRKDKKYKDSERDYLEVKNLYLRAKEHGDDMGRLRQLRALGKPNR